MRIFVVLAAIILFALQGESFAAITGLTRVASGLSAPIYMESPPGDPTRLFIVERGGAIKILNRTTGAVLSTPFLTIPSVDSAGEGGLLGFAFHPNFATNGKFYVNVTIDNGGQVFQDAVTPFSTHVREYTVSTANPNVANTSFTTVLSFLQPQSNHNAGWIGFSPKNGYLYIPTGDGGNGNDIDPDGSDTDGDVGGHTAGIGNAQDITGNFLGKILRVDVNGDDFPGDSTRNYRIPPDNPYAGATTGDDEIWARGLRNPFRDSFDRLTGDLWLGDVGQSAREEINRQPFDAPAGENFGWRLREGNIQTPSSGIGGAIPANYRAPVYDYQRPTGDASTHPNNAFRGTVVTGGYVYRGPDPSLQGKYFFLDSWNSSGNTDDKYWMFDITNPTGTVANINSLLTSTVGSRQFPTSFGEDAAGNLYIAYIGSGEVYRIDTAPLPGDFDYDGDVDNADFGIWRATLGLVSATAPADANRNGVVDAADYVIWRNNSGTSLGAAVVPEPSTAMYVCNLGAMLLAAVVLRRRPRLATMSA
jgi:glucose/arabinose dehydrogenase